MKGHGKDGVAAREAAGGEKHLSEKDENLDTAHRVYRHLKERVMSYQIANVPDLADWRARLLSERTAGAGQTEPEGAVAGLRRPYFTLSDLPDSLVLELWQLLNGDTECQSGRQNMKKLLAHFKETGTLADEEMLVRLHFAFSGAAAIARRAFSVQELEAASVGWASPCCPVCGERAHISLLRPPVGKRRLFCRICGQEWPAKRVGCILCGSEEAKAQTYLRSDGYPGIAMVVCQACGEHFKELDLRENEWEDFLWEDVRTLPLDYAAEQWLAEKRKQEGALQ